MPGSDLGIVLPTDNDTFSDILAGLLTAIQTIQADIEAKIDAGALNITTPLTLNGAALTNTGGVRLVGGESTVAGTVYVDSDGDLHVVTPVGDVQITFNGALDVTAVGAIGGDYGGGNPASVEFDNTSGEYRFLEDVNVWATLVAENIKLKVNGGTGSVQIGTLSSITTAKEFNFKSLPSSGVGGLAYEAASSGLVDANVVRETTDHKFTSIDLTGNVKVSSRVIPISAAEMQPRNDGGLGATMSTNMSWTHSVSGASSIYVPIKLPVGAIIESFSWKGVKASAIGTISARLRRLEPNVGDTALGTGVSNSANNPGALTLTESSINHTVLAGNMYYILISTSGVAGGDETSGVFLTVSGPVV